MTSDSAPGAGFPFHPFQDFLLGEVIFKTLKELNVPSEAAEDAVRSHLPSGRKDFLFTPNAKKQTLMNLYPEKIRDFLKAGKKEEIKKEFRTMISSEGKLDLALELLEWLFTGFEEKELLNELFSLVLNDKITLPENFIETLKKNYEEEVLKDLENLD
ncbi:hypothetical protein [Leptospira adleri]|uniref:Uncharacterized protein n=1 Tax=Leptospira adleri TaxID=2023186 RepID=A0A2M9YMR3_9LEPT|nr:hypothetical protein [Leptospira adleri]PJZ52843.1 hypothetical protein CH380_12310 [Leptospira adleri]PJZ60750.1 hypothetical protein CH376_16890 [Leptospira adleri]